MRPIRIRQIIGEYPEHPRYVSAWLNPESIDTIETGFEYDTGLLPTQCLVTLKTERHFIIDESAEDFTDRLQRWHDDFYGTPIAK